ncbi:hypothetical protein BH09PLA1_BH09PLA1_34110 [soil metagenome]
MENRSPRRSRSAHAGKFSAGMSLLAAAALFASPLFAEDRTITGASNNIGQPSRGAANTAFIRLGYPSDYPGDGSGSTILTDAQRANARTISNTLGTQTGDVLNNRSLSSYIWMWGQFITHDLDLASTSNGSAVNGTANIAVGGTDPLGPNPIPMTRSNFVTQGGTRQQVNAITTWIDASMVYGSDATRAAALRTNSGTGAKLVTSANNLPGYNTAGLANDNNGTASANQLFLCGDVRANENVGLTAMHTVFMREHNRLVDVISAQQPTLSNEQKYQLARKIVGAEMQTVTYREFLPALLGTSNAPKATDYAYDPQENGSITQSFALAAFRFGHSTLSGTLPNVNNDGTQSASLALRNAFFNPNLVTNAPATVESLLKGGATQVAQEIDMKFVDDVRNFLFGPAGAGGMDLAALNIERGRDHGLADYRTLRGAYGLSPVVNFNQIPTTPAMRTSLQSLYGNIDNIDGYVAGLAENHLAGSSVGPLFNAIIAGQFQRLRDGDRLFYLANAAGLYSNGVLRPEIASILNLDTIRLSDIIALNTGLNSLAVQGNLFFAQTPGDFSGDRLVNATDIDQLFHAFAGSPPTADLRFDINADNVVVPHRGAIGSDTDHLIHNILLTEYGDSDLNRTINFDDYAHIDNGYNNSLVGWANGDFDGNDVINFDDYAIIDAAFNLQGQSLEAALNWLEGEDRSAGNNSAGVLMVARHFEEFGTDYANAFYTAVPEPASAGVIALALVSFARRRRTR